MFGDNTDAFSIGSTLGEERGPQSFLQLLKTVEIVFK